MDIVIIGASNARSFDLGEESGRARSAIGPKQGKLNPAAAIRG
jgi:hypothetical protein